ncbi:hypothetical protein FBU30_005405 [Linnemannia zychae]|nr:hypothetical protein FBU30_005405 [Linnemannia zychae]
MDQALQHYYQVILHLEAVWCLAEPIFEQLRTFTIPYMFNIKQYHKVVNRFKSLEKIRFVMSEMFEDPFYSTILLQAKRAHNDEVIQDMIRFVQEHARLFVGQLKSVECLAGYMWEKLDQEYANHIRLEIYRLLPPLPMPICLDKYNWMQFCAHPQSTDLSHVQEFTYMGLPDGWENTICNDQSILQRCRALKRLYASTSCEVDFKWAVQEKNDMNRVGWIPMGNRTNDGHGALTSEMSTHGLVPAQH